MELGYNTDVTIQGKAYHVQTEGRLDSNPRIDTLVYQSGSVLKHLSNPDERLGTDDRLIEETKRKIRSQHLEVVALVRREEFDRIDSIEPDEGIYDFLDLLPDEVASAWREVFAGRFDNLCDEWKRSMADAYGLITPDPRYQELRRILDIFACYLEDDAVSFEKKQGLLTYLLRFDAEQKVLDFCEAFRREKGGVPQVSRLVTAIKTSTDQLLNRLIKRSSSGSGLGTELILELFIRQSMELVKHLFEQAERKMAEQRPEQRDVLPTVLLYLEEKVASENIPNRELDDIFDRLNYLYARLSVKTVRELSSQIGRIRTKIGLKANLRSSQKKKVVEYINFLEVCKEQIEKQRLIEDKLVKIQEFKTAIDDWDKVLRLYINVRLALKGYHNFVTVNILESAELVTMKLQRELPKLAPPWRKQAEEVLTALRKSLDAKMNVRNIVIPAVQAQELLDSIRRGAMPADEAVEATPIIEEELVEVESEDAEAPAARGELSPRERIHRISQRIKISSLQLLRATEDLRAATREIQELEQAPGLPKESRMQLAACRRDLVLKKKVLQHKLSAL